MIPSRNRKFQEVKGGMITMGQWAAIRQLEKQGFGKRTIARMLGISRNTVRRTLKQEEMQKTKRLA
jgi:DNA invertase Pin-like site-specific DNA recombinase